MSYSFFGVQVAFKREERDPLRGQLHHLLARDAGARQSVTAKQRFWKHLSALLATATFEYGDWDLVRGGRAEELFNEWAREIEESAATEPENAGTPSSSYVLATAMVLVDRGSNADETLGNECDILESAWLTRQTFAQLVSIFPLLNFANVQADAFFVVPGHERAGPSARDLVSEDYGLQPLT